MSILSASATHRADPGALLTQVGTGSTEAFADLYDLIAPLVHGLSVAALPDPATAEQATEAIFVQLWRHAPHYRSDRQEPVPWILALSYQVLADRCGTRSATHPDVPVMSGRRTDRGATHDDD